MGCIYTVYIYNSKATRTLGTIYEATTMIIRNFSDIHFSLIIIAALFQI